MASLAEISKALDDNRSRLYKRDYTFYNIAFISTLAKMSEREASAGCQKCLANTEKLLVLASAYPDMISSGGSGRKQLEDSIEDIANHLIKEHGYARGNWYKPLYSLWGFAIGLVLAAVCFFAIPDGAGYQKVAILLALSAPVLTGYIAGGVKDFKYEKSGKKL